MPALVFLNNYKILLGLLAILYIVFKYLHYRGMRKENAFDTFFVFIIIQALVQKAYYFYLNYQNFPSILEIILNLNIASDAFFLALIVNFLIAYSLSKRFRFSVYHILDSLTVSTIIFTFFYSFDFQNPLANLNLIYLFLVLIVLLTIKRNLISGFLSFAFVFLFTNISIIYSYSTNSLIFYILLNTMNALLILRRSKYMEKHLSSDFIENSKAKLIARREELIKEIEDIDNNGPRDMGDSDYIDEVMDDQDIENGKINKRFLTKVLEKINRALQRIDEGKYGYDQKTGQPIDKARLELFPEAEENVR